MVSGDDHDLAARSQRGADLAENRRGGGDRIAHRALTQLDHVAEQDQPVDAAQRVQQGPPGDLTP